MNSKSLKFLISFIIYSIVLLISMAKSDAPFKVYFVNAISLLIGFFIPSLFSSSVKTILKKWYLLLTFILLGVFIWDFLKSQVIVKADFFVNAHIIYPIGILFLLMLLIIHNLLLGYAIKKEL